MSETDTAERCGITFRFRSYTSVCNRLLTDPCTPCKIFDAHKEDWAAVFNGPQPGPRAAVDGDI